MDHHFSFSFYFYKFLQKTNLHFRGARIFRVVIEDLLSKGMSNAQNVCSHNPIIPLLVRGYFCLFPLQTQYNLFCYSVQAILSGCSAGGLTSILHCDKFKSLLPKTTKVKCLSDAGYFINS